MGLVICQQGKKIPFRTTSRHLLLFFYGPSPKNCKISKFTVNVSKHSYLTTLIEETGLKFHCLNFASDKKNAREKNLFFARENEFCPRERNEKKPKKLKKCP